MYQVKAFERPHSLAEARGLLLEHGRSARVLAGGTSLALSRAQNVEVLVDLSRLGLGRVEQRPDGLHLGAMATCSDVRLHLEGADPTVISDAASTVGSRILQNQVTVGGNCTMVYAWSDLPVACWCVGATFVVQGAQERRIAADDFFAQNPSRVLGEGELLTEVIVPAPAAGEGSAYLKVTRNATDQSIASAAALVTLDQGVIKTARLVVGAVRAMPQLLAGATDLLTGKAPGAALLGAAADKAAEEVKVMSDFKASAEYRRQLVQVLATDALSLAVERAGGAS